MNPKARLIVLAVALVSFLLAVSNALACKVMGQESGKRVRADEICRHECNFHGGWSGRVEDRRKNLGVNYVDCYCNKEPADALCQ